MVYAGNRLADISLHLAHRTMDPTLEEFHFPRIYWLENVYNDAVEMAALYGTVRGERQEFTQPADFEKMLKEQAAPSADIGTATDQPLLRGGEPFDYRPTNEPGTSANVFVPWALYREVGLWHFRETTDTNTTFDQHWHLQPMHTHRNMYHEMPEYHFDYVPAPNSSGGFFVYR